MNGLESRNVEPEISVDVYLAVGAQHAQRPDVVGLNKTAVHEADLKAIWCDIIWRVNYPSTVDEAVQRLFPAFELLYTLLD